jgi:hypothetical protein
MPTCPQDYNCNFTLIHPRVIYHNHTVGPWWQHTAGWVVAIVAAIALACVIAYIAKLYSDRQDAKLAFTEREKDRQHKLDLEEQYTMQAELAKGDPNMLREIRNSRLA